MNSYQAEAIGILGGSFNPVHTGHLLLAQRALETYDLSKVLLVPCAVPAHKEASALIEARHRLAMVQLAVEDDFRFEVSDIELGRGGVSYAIDSVSQLRAQRPAASLYFIIGADTLRELHLWKDIGNLLRLCRFVSFGRPGFATDAASAGDLHLPAPWSHRLLADLTPGPLANISSSDIRHRLAEGMSIRYLVPPAVEMYIAEHALYTG